MQVLRIKNQKEFTSKLFAGDTFAAFLVIEASFTTGASFYIDGSRNATYYKADYADKEEETAALFSQPYLSWKELQPVCYAIIRGKRLPVSFKIVLAAPASLVKDFLTKCDGLTYEDVESLPCTISYKDGEMTVTSGISLRIFTLDKSPDAIWDRVLLSFLDKENISCEILS